MIVRRVTTCYPVKKEPSDPLGHYHKANFKSVISLVKSFKRACINRLVFLNSFKTNGEKTLYSDSLRLSFIPCRLNSYSLSRSELGFAHLKFSKVPEAGVVIIRHTLIYGLGVKRCFSSLSKLAFKCLMLLMGTICDKVVMVCVENLYSLIQICLDKWNEPKGNFTLWL